MAKNKKVVVRKTSVRKAATNGQVRTRVPRPVLSQAERAYLTMLNDPCKAPMVSAPYAGTDSGYKVRTVEYLTVPALGFTGVAGAATLVDFIVQFTPAAYNTGVLANVGYLSSGTPAGGIQAPTPTTSACFITSTAVKKFRAVAGCLKWVPSGPYASRAGVIGMSYTSGQQFQFSATVANAALAMSNMMDVSSNGSREHAVKFLPSATDEDWSDPAISENSTYGGGTMCIVGTGIDGVLTGTGTTANANGYIEVTTIWEWLPAKASGLASAPNAPLPFTTQSVLSKISDIAGFAMSATGGAVEELVTRGVRASVRNMTGFAMTGLAGMAMGRASGNMRLTY